MSEPRFYATIPHDHLRPDMPAIPILLSAASSAAIGRKRGKTGTLPVPSVPAQVTEIAVDPGGFTAQQNGGYIFSWAAYEDWLGRLGPRLSWAAFPDLPCEKELASDRYAVRARQEQTLEWAWELWGGLDDTENDGLDVLRSWGWVATIQGRDVADYVRMARELAPLLTQQLHHYAYTAYAADLLGIYGEDDAGSVMAAQHRRRAMRGALTARVAIGSLCKRTKASDVVAIVRAVADELPGERFHLWGVKLGVLGALRDAGLLDRVASLDSSAWNGRFGSDIADFDRARAERGMSQRAYGVLVKLPEYVAKIERAIAAPAQERLL